MKERSEACFRAGIEMMQCCEISYLQLLQENSIRPAPRGVFLARLLGMNFAVSSMTLALGRGGHSESESVYRSLLAEARKGLKLKRSDIPADALEYLTTTNEALIAEKNNVGSGQYALAGLYEKALRQSLEDRSNKGKQLTQSPAQVLGKMVALLLGKWAELYTALSGKPMQEYQEGFLPSEKDARPLSD